MDKSRKKQNKILIYIAAAIATLLYIIAVLLFGRQKPQVRTILAAPSALPQQSQAASPSPEASPTPKPAMLPPVAAFSLPAGEAENITATNAKNGGIIAVAEDLVYICSPFSQIICENAEGKSVGVIEGIKANGLFYADGWLYYCDETLSNAICRLEVSRGQAVGEPVALNEGQYCSAPSVYGGRVYYQVSEKKGGRPTQIWSMDTRGAGRTMLVKCKFGEALGLCVYRGHYYYLNWKSQPALMRGDLRSGSEPKLLHENTGDYVFYEDSMILCTGEGIVRTDMQGGNPRTISQIIAGDAIEMNGVLFFSDRAQKEWLCSLDLKKSKSKAETLVKHASVCLSLGIGSIYYKTNSKSMHGEIYNYVPPR